MASRPNEVDAELLRAAEDETIDGVARACLIVLLRARREHADVSADLDVIAAIRRRDHDALPVAIARALRVRAARYARTLRAH